MALFFVDCEAVGPCPRLGKLTEFGCVHLTSKSNFHGRLWSRDGVRQLEDAAGVFRRFDVWLKERVATGDRPIFVSDNPAWDFQWIQDGFWMSIGRNPFGHSGRRISDFYAGLVGDFYKAVRWKHLRVTPHDHNPVNDAMGNVEAFERMLRGER